MITKEQYEKLSKYDRPLECAYKANYAHIAPNEMRHVLEIYYGPEWDKQVPKQVFSCSHCKLKELKKIGEEYYEYERREGAA